MPETPDFTEWESQSGRMSPRDIRTGYDVYGWEGYVEEPEQAERLERVLMYKTWSDAAEEFGTTGSGEGKLSRPWLAATKHAPDIFPGPAQTRGDCVSRGTAAAVAVSMFCEIEGRQPDEETGLLETYEPVKFPEEGVVSSEILYACRGHRGEGASCDRLAYYVSTEGGILLRKKYKFKGYGPLDLRKYDGDIGYKMGPMPPKEILDRAGNHPCRTVTRIKDIKQARDALANGYGMNVGSDRGFSSRRDRYGVSSGSGYWAHAMAWIGVNDDPNDPACQEHGRPLFLVLNSWGTSWNSGPRYHDQPAGSFWIKPRTAQNMLRRGSGFAFSRVSGFPAQELPDYGASTRI